MFFYTADSFSGSRPESSDYIPSSVPYPSSFEIGVGVAVGRGVAVGVGVAVGHGVAVGVREPNGTGLLPRSDRVPKSVPLSIATESALRW